VPAGTWCRCWAAAAAWLGLALRMRLRCHQPLLRRLQEFDGIRESELTALSTRIAEREDGIMWKEFRERFMFHLGLVSQPAETCCQGLCGRAAPCWAGCDGCW
jgi:hypothetical protein